MDNYSEYQLDENCQVCTECGTDSAEAVCPECLRGLVGEEREVRAA